ncbi:MAG: GGDEF domain-containing protein [Helicobacteraceae bacterium]|nr:GGDEF domain-containing protein [Candidatus Sulfurimonas ponti]MBL6973406.1 GGDEF domain-containing protein [Sulfurimonas sp.]
MGLPIFLLLLAFISDTLINSYESVQISFYFTFIILLVFSVYFIFFLIYSGFDVQITDSITKTFTREYLYKYIKKEIKKNDAYTLVLLSVDNLNAINTQYGITNGDKVLFQVAEYLGNYLIDKKITNFPMGHIKGGDFIIGLEGEKENYNSIIDLLCLKSSDFKVQEIEVGISGAVTDTMYSDNLDYMIKNLFELQLENRNKKIIKKRDEINPNDLESFVIGAIDKKSVSIMTQSVYEDGEEVLKECFVKLKNAEGEVLHPKSYMKVVNKLGLTTQYDYLILEKSVLHCMDESTNLVSVTISPTSLRNHNFLVKIKNLLDANQDVKNRLVLMCSEIDYYSHIDRYNEILQSLRAQGVKIAIDRLGSLHSSFLYLRDLEIDIVRFDSYYTKNKHRDKNKNIIDGLNTMAHLSGVKTWIKMIEDKNTQEFAKDLKIDYVQGKELANLEKIYED